MNLSFTKIEYNILKSLKNPAILSKLTPTFTNSPIDFYDILDFLELFGGLSYSEAKELYCDTNSSRNDCITSKYRLVVMLYVAIKEYALLSQQLNNSQPNVTERILKLEKDNKDLNKRLEEELLRNKLQQDLHNQDLEDNNFSIIQLNEQVKIATNRGDQAIAANELLSNHLSTFNPKKLHTLQNTVSKQEYENLQNNLSETQIALRDALDALDDKYRLATDLSSKSQLPFYSMSTIPQLLQPQTPPLVVQYKDTSSTTPQLTTGLQNLSAFSDYESLEEMRKKLKELRQKK